MYMIAARDTSLRAAERAIDEANEIVRSILSYESTNQP